MAYAGVCNAIFTAGLGRVIFVNLILVDAHGQRFLAHLFDKGGLTDKDAVDNGRDENKGGLQDKERKIIGFVGLGNHDRDGDEHKTRPRIADDLFDRVRLGSKWARRNIGHDGNRHDAIGAYCQ